MSNNKNTRRAPSIGKTFSKSGGTNERNMKAILEEYVHEALDQTLSQFNAKLQKENEDDYKPDSFKVMQAVIIIIIIIIITII